MGALGFYIHYTEVQLPEPSIFLCYITGCHRQRSTFLNTLYEQITTTVISKTYTFSCHNTSNILSMHAFFTQSSFHSTFRTTFPFTM